MANGPIADLSYRTYDGPLEPPLYRWWSIAKMSMRLSIKKKGFWVWAVLSAYWYAVLACVFYFAESMVQEAAAGEVNMLGAFFAQIVWKDQFLNAFSVSQMLLLIVALLIGAGSIANDNRANALLVYLSKPCTKLDYLLGKWFGIFIPLLLVTLVPMLLFFLYCLLSYRGYGFLTQDPYLFPKLLAITPLPAIFHASVLIGVSSLFNQGRIAGAAYAGVYFMTLFFTKAMQVVRVVSIGQDRSGEVPPMVDTLYYMSIDGLQIGLAKVLLDTRGSPLVGGGPRAGRMQEMMPTIPDGRLLGAIFVVLCVTFVFIAWRRIRAVEVVA
jgi:ABC-2 type transport system permease protein